MTKERFIFMKLFAKMLYKKRASLDEERIKIKTPPTGVYLIVNDLGGVYFYEVIR